jgi:nucleotide-binding universal stress UspA family protein
MFKHILIATDGSELAGKAVAAGLVLAKELNARVTAVTAIELGMDTVGRVGLAVPVIDYEKAASVAAAIILDEVSTVAKSQGVQCETVHVIESPAEAIIATANSKQCDLIVMSSNGRRGLARVLLGSQAMRVLTQSSVPVLICR